MTVDEVAADLFASLKRVAEETGATDEEMAEALGDFAALMGGFPPKDVSGG
jgi:hypothetical protein